MLLHTPPYLFSACAYQRSEGRCRFFADLAVQILYVHYKIGCFILLFYLCAYNGRSYRICLHLTHYFICISCSLFIKWRPTKMRRWHFFVCCCYDDVGGVFHWPFYFCSLITWPPGSDPSSRRCNLSLVRPQISNALDNFPDACILHRQLARLQAVMPSLVCAGLNSIFYTTKYGINNLSFIHINKTTR